MLEYIQGTLVEKGEGEAVVEVGGLGFHLFIPLSTHLRLPSPGERCRLWTHLHLGDKGPSLFGFTTKDEKRLFRTLITIPRLGPKTALAVVSHFTLGDLWRAVEERDLENLKKVPGIGEKTAERLLVELKGKVTQEGEEVRGPWESSIVSALANLGYTHKEIKRALREAQVTPQMGEEEMIKRCLRVLGGSLG